MATKSRLGKGLGALFPALPGDPAEQETEQSALDAAADKAAAKQSSAATRTQGSGATHAAKTSDTSKRHQPKTTVNTVNTDAQQGDNAAEHHAATAESSNGTHVSRETKSKSSRRAAMPALSEIAHPSDLFFGTTMAVPAAEPVQPAESDTRHDQSTVSRETVEPQSDELKPVAGGYLVELKLDQIGPNLHQPRTIFDEDELRELSDSIREVGVLQPIVVRKRPANQSVGEPPDEAAKASEYELIMGERRWRASRLAGMETIPAIVKTTADDDMLRDALLENLHRVALNPLEEAAAYQQMIEEFGLTQAELSRSVSKSRPQIANTLRLLNLPAGVQKKVASGVLSAGHARALLGLSSEEDMEKLANRIIAEGLSVRSTEEIVAMQANEGEKQKKARAKTSNPWSGSPIQQNLENRFDTKVSIKGTPKHGRIEIVFSSPEDMDRILGLLMPDAPSDSSQWV